jgi:hypothetical protein
MHTSTPHAPWRPTVKAIRAYRTAAPGPVPSPSDQDIPGLPTPRKQELIPSSGTSRAFDRLERRRTTASGHLLDSARGSAHRTCPC